MLKKKLLILALALGLCTVGTATTAAASTPEASVTLESCGAYLFEWRPVDCGNGHYFAILAGNGNIAESDVILNRGYDFAYTFDPTYSSPWGQAPDLSKLDGKWGIPENWDSMPEGSHPTLQIVLVTNNKNFAAKERYIDVVKLPSGVAGSDLPPEVRKYLINMDGTDAGAYTGIETTGWVRNDDGTYRYRMQDGTFVTDSWLKLDDHSYYMNKDGIMLADTMAPDGSYVNASGEKTNYIPGWKQNGKGWRYMMKNGQYVATAWLEDNGKWYYFNIGTYMMADADTPDGYHVDASGVWDGQPSTINNTMKLGPAFAQQKETE